MSLCFLRLQTSIIYCSYTINNLFTVSARLCFSCTFSEYIENIIKGSHDIINEIDDKETNARLQKCVSNPFEMTRGSPRAHSVPAGKRKSNSSSNVQHRCNSIDVQFVKSYRMSSCSCSITQADHNIRQQRSYALRDPATPNMKTSPSFSYFPFPPDHNVRIKSSGDSQSSSLSFSPAEVTSHYCRARNCSGAQNGSSQSTDDISSIAEGSDVTSEDFDDVDMLKQWQEWEALTRDFEYNNECLNQETFV